MKQVYRRTRKEKRGTFLSPRTMLSPDPQAGTITVADANDRHMVSAAEDSRLAFVDDDSSAIVFESGDAIDDSIPK